MAALSRLAGCFLQFVYSLRRRIASEETFVKRSLAKFSASGQTLLEVGCGYCRFQPIVESLGLDYVGVEKNPATAAGNVARGIQCIPPQDVDRSLSHVDVLLLAHIVEHFDYEALVEFLNRYLPIVKTDGIVIILTPLLHRGFYDDFDHVKPYNPGAIRQVFMSEDTQTQAFDVRGEFDEIDFWLKRDSLWHSYRESRWMHIIKVPLSLLTTLSFGLIGRRTGYGIVFRKLGD